MGILTRRPSHRPDYEKIARLECELLGISRHPYGTSPEGLIDEVRVRHEEALRESGGWMPPLVERLATAEAEARQLWPEHFDVVSLSAIEEQ